MKSCTLYTAPRKKRCILESIPDEKLLQSLGIRSGVELSIVSRQPFGGPVTIKLGDRCLAISKSIAEQISIREVG